MFPIPRPDPHLISQQMTMQRTQTHTQEEPTNHDLSYPHPSACESSHIVVIQSTKFNSGVWPSILDPDQPLLGRQ